MRCSTVFVFHFKRSIIVFHWYIFVCVCVLQKAFAHVTNAARTANRVVAVTKGESENTTDVEYKGKLDSTQAAVTAGGSGGVVSTSHGCSFCCARLNGRFVDGILGNFHCIS